MFVLAPPRGWLRVRPSHSAFGRGQRYLPREEDAFHHARPATFRYSGAPGLCHRAWMGRLEQTPADRVRTARNRIQWGLIAVAVGSGIACRSDNAASSTPASPPTAPTRDTVPRLVEIVTTGPLSLRRGDSARISARVKNSAGQVVSAQIDWRSSNTAIASVGSDGLVIARARGSVTITARASAATADIVITVTARPEVISWDTLATFGATFRIRGIDLDGSSATVNGRSASVQIFADTLLSLTIPASLAAPCWPSNRPLEIGITNGTFAVTRSVPTVPVPTTIDLDLGQYALVSDEIHVGCGLRVVRGGKYRVIAYTVEAGATTMGDSVVLRIPKATAVASATFAAANSPWIHSLLATPQSDVIRADIRPVPGGRANQAAACSARAIGDTAFVAVTRNAAGEIGRFGGSAEPVIVVGVGPQVLVFFDTATVRLAQTDAQYAWYIQDFLAAWATYVTPTIAMYTRGLPDKDANGRVDVIMGHRYDLNDAAGRFNFAFPSGWRIGCPAGEGIWQQIPFAQGHFNPPPGVALLAPVVSVALHEAAHLTDVGYPDQNVGLASALIEGYATFLQVVLQQGPGDTQLLHRNAPTERFFNYGSTGTKESCVWPDRRQFGAAYAFPSYAGGCYMLSWLFGRSDLTMQAGAPSTIARWSGPAMRTSSTSMAGYFARFLGDRRPPWMPWGEMLLSWAADDRLPGVSADITNTMWNTPSALAALPPLPLFQPVAIPEMSIARGPGDVSIRLGVPDARFFDVISATGDEWSFVRTASLPTANSRTALALLRVQ